MYKRPPSKNAFQYKEPKSKMRKLNVSLTGASNQSTQSNPSNVLQLQKPTTSTSINDKPNPTSSSGNSIRKPDVTHQTQRNNVPPPPVPPAKDENLWADADDEFILIASQMVDNMDMDAINQQIIVQSMNMSQNNMVEIKMPNEEQDVVKNLLQFTEEDDRIFSEINNFDVIGNPNLRAGTLPQANERPVSPSVFKVPSEVPRDKRAPIQTSTQIDMNFTFRPQDQPQSTQFSQNIEIPRPMEPTESQAQSQNLKVKFLTQKQGDLQKEIEHLQCENQRITELCQTKDGESSLLRSENERLKNQFDNIRKEKSNEISKVRNDLSMKMSELEKTILDLKSQLQFKEMSSLHQQSRKSICSQQSQQSVVRQKSETLLHDWEKFKLPTKSCLPVQAVRPVDPRLYISSKLSDSYWVSMDDKKQWEFLNGLQLILADLMSNKDLNSNSISKMLDETFNLALSSVNQMYVASEKDHTDPKKNDVSCTHSDVGEWTDYSIVSENKLFDREEAFLSRRILVCLATICERFPQLSSMLFQRRGGDETKSVMEFLSITIRTFSYYKNVESFQGVIESSCHLLTILADNDNILNSQSVMVFANTLHNILLCRPGIGSLEKISKFLELMSCRPENEAFLDALCCSRNTCDIAEPQGYIKYTEDSCTLQIYALLIRLHILPHEKIKFSIKQLTVITQSTILFMRYSLLQSPKWLITDKRGSCLCRARMFGVVVTLLYVYLLHWIEYPNEIDSNSVSTVAKFGIEFLYDNLVKHYVDDLLNAGGTIIKNRIRMVVEWLNLYDFKFKSAHQHALQSVCLQRLGPMVEYLRYNKNITSKYSAEAAEVYNNVVDTFFDEID
ncbi:uncharacterized protein LOC119082296 [Bradysia coprophila]|uniref:uncharacterized protein LOC119082296 n=1 Tax=Bradysia coprophila TaxID=38358 RepID=UPI00187D8CEB|nr:uncharacterized protein LOC119082296 [Bradysia coprophila]